MFSDEQKREFALRYLEYRRDASKAASRLFPFDVAARMAALDLVYDPAVIEETERLLEAHGYDYFLPSKFEVAAELYDTALKARCTDDKVKALRTYADVMGMIEKPGTVIDARTQIDNRSVLVVRDFGTEADWEAKAIAQQQNLIADASNSDSRREAA